MQAIVQRAFSLPPEFVCLFLCSKSKNRQIWHTPVFPRVNPVFMFLLRVLIGSILDTDAFVVVTVYTWVFGQATCRETALYIAIKLSVRSLPHYTGRVSLWTRIKCVRSTIHRRHFKIQQSLVVLDLCLRKTRSDKTRDYRDVIVFEKLSHRFFDG